MSLIGDKDMFELLATSAGGHPDTCVVLMAGSGAPSGGKTHTGQTLAATQTAYYFRAGATSGQGCIYVTINGGTNWTAIASRP